jgi:hypothetical protein
MTLVCHVFGEEGAAYVQAYLEENASWGKRLGALLLARADIGAGSVRAWIPEGHKARAGQDFEHSLATKEVWARDRPCMGEFLVDRLRQVGDGAVLLSEDAYARPTDGWIAQSDRHLVFCGDDVYDLATAETAADQVDALVYGAFWDPAVAIVGRLPGSAPPLSSKQGLDESVLAHVATTATAIAVGAWDEEGAVVWTPTAEVG